MCVVFFAYRQTAEFPLILIANRDEFYERPTLAAARWDDDPQVFAGRDLVLGGTWLGYSDRGRFAAVTNYREPGAPRGDLSRGRLTADFLAGERTIEEFVAAAERDADRYSGFNLLIGEFAGERSELRYLSNRGGGSRVLDSGIYGLSNAHLDTPWPKVARGKGIFSSILREGADDERFFELLCDEEKAPDDELPSTGLSMERERALSSIFIATPIYGTRCSSILKIDREHYFTLTERVFV